MPSENLRALQAGYDAFARQDIPAVMELIHDDIEWIEPDSTLLGGRYHGKEEVMGLFGRMAELIGDLHVEPREFIESGDRVVVIARLTGRGERGPLDVESAHVWRMRDGRSVEFHEYGDTARMNAAVGEPTGAKAGR